MAYDQAFSNAVKMGYKKLDLAEVEYLKKHPKAVKLKRETAYLQRLQFKDAFEKWTLHELSKKGIDKLTDQAHLEQMFKDRIKNEMFKWKENKDHDRDFWFGSAEKYNYPD